MCIRDSYYNLGNVFRSKDNLILAIENYNKAISIKPDYAEAYNNMGIALTGFIFKKPNKGLQNTISSLLNKKLYVRPTDISLATISLLKTEPILQKQLKLVSDDRIIQNPLEIVLDLDELPLLLKLMSVCPIPDLSLIHI